MLHNLFVLFSVFDPVQCLKTQDNVIRNGSTRNGSTRNEGTLELIHGLLKNRSESVRQCYGNNFIANVTKTDGPEIF